MTKDHWENIYTRRDPTEVSWYQSTPARSLAWIEEVVGDRRDTAIIDVGAGASALVDELLARGFENLTVLDVSPAALAHVRSRLGGRGDCVEWVATDVLDFTPCRPFDLWHDRAVLHFLCAPADQRRYAEILRASLVPGGHALIATFAVGGPRRCSDLDVVQYDAGRLLHLLGNGFRLLRSELETHRTPGGTDQLFHYGLVQRCEG